jgi:3-methyladenine DNA glycosylase Tag
LKNHRLIWKKIKIESHVNKLNHLWMFRDWYYSFDKYTWGFVEHKSDINSFTSFNEMSASMETSKRMTKDLKNNGFIFEAQISGIPIFRHWKR